MLYCFQTKQETVHEGKKNEPLNVLQYVQGFFLFCGEVNRLG